MGAIVIATTVTDEKGTSRWVVEVSGDDVVLTLTYIPHEKDMVLKAGEKNVWKLATGPNTVQRFRAALQKGGGHDDAAHDE